MLHWNGGGQCNAGNQEPRCSFSTKNLSTKYVSLIVRMLTQKSRKSRRGGERATIVLDGNALAVVSACAAWRGAADPEAFFFSFLRTVLLLFLSFKVYFSINL